MNTPRARIIRPIKSAGVSSLPIKSTSLPCDHEKNIATAKNSTEKSVR
ncbi:Uncharacterised protein [Vibrio cholerae]|nr:Uncharacterised protein [Vibrio cholerae]